ncbi:MAG: N-acetyltransferase [Planctomycetota bacterium]|nr:N-acetyltransferase [Planctomycetota bacterium]
MNADDAEIVIRSEHVGDHVAIAEVNREAFGQEGEPRLVAALRDAEGFDPQLSLVTLRDDAVVGHILFSPIELVRDEAKVPALALAPMAVRPEYQRQGIGSALVRAGLKACGRAGYRMVVVLGHADYYPRFGFTPAGKRGVRAPFDVPDEAFMVLGLVDGGLDDVAGVVRYPAPFSDL